MTDQEKLVAMRACQSALDWIGDRTIEQAWKDCQRADWMCWLLKKIAPNDPRCRLAAADFAERVWHLIPNEPTKLAAAWAIGAARRGDADEMRAATYAAAAAVAYTAAAASADAYTAATAATAAADAAADAVATVAAAAAAYAAAYAVADDVADDAYAAAITAERASQADILRQYFSAREIAVMFSRS